VTFNQNNCTQSNLKEKLNEETENQGLMLQTFLV
jgi:hypothetical protein